METKMFSKSWVSSIINYSILIWTIICFIGTWVIIIKYGILLEGLIALVVTFFFAAIIWAIPFAGFILLTLFVTPPEEPSHYMMFRDLIKKPLPFRDLIRKGMRRSSE
ncbi:MAG: hypothetical protein AB1502_04065 [Thermodesulfobacteriota bacterium]